LRDPGQNRRIEAADRRLLAELLHRYGCPGCGYRRIWACASGRVAVTKGAPAQRRTGRTGEAIVCWAHAGDWPAVRYDWP
jgi:predicted RNA-binding Zn-ribbon protein involved in translation (DUF1610 family)